MSQESKVIDGVKQGDVPLVMQLLESGADVHSRDEHGWTPLNWAAGQGNTEIIKLLLNHGADVTLRGRDNRTALMIAKAAGHKEAIATLTEAEQERGVWEDPREVRPYCKAYYLRDLRRFPSWTEKAPSPTRGDTAAAGDEDDGTTEMTDESIVYVHQDLTVTRSMWHSEDIVYEDVTPDWRRFCEEVLEFSVPDDLL